MLQKVLANDVPFLMGHVLVGASQCLAPLMHQDALDAVASLQAATHISKQGKLTKMRLEMGKKRAHEALYNKCRRDDNGREITYKSTGRGGPWSVLRGSCSV